MSLWNAGEPGLISEARKKMSRIDKLRKIVADQSYAKVDGVSVDMTTANMLVKVYDAISPANQKKFVSLPIRQMVSLGWKLVRG